MEELVKSVDEDIEYDARVKVVGRNMLRPNGELATAMTLVIESPTTAVQPNQPNVPEENKLSFFFSEEEWQLAKKRFLVGDYCRIKIRKNGRIEIG